MWGAGVHVVHVVYRGVWRSVEVLTLNVLLFLVVAISINLRSHSPHAEHEHWEPGVKFESENQNDWHPSTGKYYHHEVGQPTGQMEPDKLDL